MLSMSTEKSRNKLPNIKNDYLKEIKKENEKIYNSENNKGLNEEEDYIKNSAKKWNKLINDNTDGSLVDNINNARNKIEKLEYEALQNEKLLKSQDDINKSAELNKKVSSLIIDSIQAKITLLQQMK